MTNRSEEINELAAALVAAQSEFTAIPKSSENPFFKSKYAALPDVVQTASPVLAKHGLAVSQFPGFDEHGDTLTTWLLHTSGQFICESMRLHLTKQDAQGQGSATTYARRYAYMGALGLVADEDDDGNAAGKKTVHPAQRYPARTPDGNLLTEKQRDRVLAGVGKAGRRLSDVLTAIGVESIETMTVGDAVRMRDYLDAPASDVPSDLPAEEPDPELDKIAAEVFGG